MCVDVLSASVVEILSPDDLKINTVPGGAATVVRRRAGAGFVIGGEREIFLTDDDLLDFRSLATLTTDLAIRSNDGGCDPLGNLIIGTMAYDESPGKGSLYRVTPNGNVTTLISSISISNGVQWSRDGSRVFYIDTPTRRVDVFDVDDRSGSWSRRRPHIRVDDEAGFPDGMAIDENDGLWVAMWGGASINHYDDSGVLVDVVTVPGVSQVSSCAFGGSDMDRLFITTSRKNLDDSTEPDAGAVFAADVSVRGARITDFGG
ncbi:gluconolactonase [Mycolicibacterium psychrotolerans]|uniref:Gluconolactonase n=2 Tax=Mycolicibacterium psychrotolerans TaxID=216929 RepID=A0A7I7MI99_9MYCO|nr:gluconolactonase [Mycolicibacterium psychrotolerans]